MTDKQEKLYWREWAAVRAAWPEANRHELHVRALGEDKSHKLFSNRDFDLVLAEFRAVSKPSDLAGQLRQLRQVKMRLIWKITVEQVALLSVFMAGEHQVERLLVSLLLVVASEPGEVDEGERMAGEARAPRTRRPSGTAPRTP